MPSQHLKSIRKKFSSQLGIIPIPLIIGAVLIITAAAASIPITYIINQSSQDTRSRAGICCEAGSCNDGWSYGRDENAPQATCEQRKQEACASHGGPASGGGSCSGGGGGGGGGGSPSCVYSDFCGGCIQANRCLQYSDGTIKYCNQWIDQECQQSGCCGNGVSCPSGQNCCQGLIKCPNGRCGTTCQAPTSTPTPTNTPIPSGTQCSGSQKECVNSISFKTCTNGYWSSSISCSSLNPSKPKCVDGACVSATASDGRKTNLANCTTPCSDVDDCICKADDCVIPQDGIVTNGNTCGVKPTPTPTPACVSPNNPINPNTQTCCSGSPQYITYWQPVGYYCIETSPSPPTSTPSPTHTPTYTPTPTASGTPSPSPTATWTPIPTPTPCAPNGNYVGQAAQCCSGLTDTVGRCVDPDEFYACYDEGGACYRGGCPETKDQYGGNGFSACEIGYYCCVPQRTTPTPTPTRTPSPSTTLTTTPTRTPSPSIPTTTATPTPSPANCTPDGGYYYATTVCCSGQHHTDFSGIEICGSSPTPTLTPAPTPAVISAIQQAAQAIATAVTQVATTIWDWIIGGEPATPTPTPSPTPTSSPSPSPSPTATAAPPPPTAAPTFTPTPSITARPTFTPTPTPTLTPTASPTPQFTLTLTQNDLMSYCVEQYGAQYSLLLTPNGYYCSYYDGQRTHQYRVDPNSICQDLTGNPSAVAVPFDNQYRCVVN